MFPLFMLPFASLVASSPLASTCTPISGDFTINSANLYPESADFDSKRCVTYISNLYINTVSTYDVNKKAITDVIQIPGITGNSVYHTSGVHIDTARDLLSIIISRGQTFLTGGEDISGDSFLVKYDLQAKKIAWQYNLADIAQGAYGGFQDVTHDRFGNSFVVGTFSSNIIKVSVDGKSATPWYFNSEKSTVAGYSGLVAFPDQDLLLVADGEKGQIVRFDLGAAKGQPVYVPLQAGAEPLASPGGLDGAHAPRIYNGTVLLVADFMTGIIVLRSQDGKWTSAEKLGVIANPYGSVATSSTDVVEIGQRLYAVTEFWDGSIPGQALDRTQFPFRDITDEVQQILA